MKSKCDCKKYEHVKLKHIAPKYKNAVGFFLKGENEAFLILDNYPFNKIPFPSVGDRVNLDSYGDFGFDYYIVEEKFYNLCNHEVDTFTYLEVTVSGHYIEV